MTIGKLGTILLGELKGTEGLVVGADSINNTVSIKIDKWCTVETSYQNVTQNKTQNAIQNKYTDQDI